MNRVVTLYSRADCHLCDEAEMLLGRLSRELGFNVEKVDISGDAKLESDYQWAIPVIAVGGREVARAPIREGRLEEALREAFGVE